MLEPEQSKIALVVGRHSWGKEIVRRTGREDLVIVLNVWDTRGRSWSGYAVPDGPTLSNSAYEAIWSLEGRGVPRVRV